MRKEIQDIQERYQNKTNLVDMVHQYIIDRDRANKMKRVAEGRIGKFYPSSVGRCRRSIAYQMLGYPGKQIPGQNLLIMENGTSFHERMEKIFEEMGIMIAPELKLTDGELRISGRSDALVWNFLREEDEPDGEHIELYRSVKDAEGNDVEELVYSGPSNDVLIIEFKSIKDKKYDKLPKTKPDKKHNMQLQLYMYMTGIRRGAVYYEDKDNQEQKYYMVDYDEKVVDKVVGDIKYVIGHLDAGTLPDRDFAPVSMDCRWCDFYEICYPPRTTYNLDDVLSQI